MATATPKWRRRAGATVLGLTVCGNGTAIDSDRFEGYTNATWLRRSLTLLLVATLRRLCRHSGCMLFLPQRYCIEYGKSLHLSEAAVMKLVTAYTMTPVPKIICAFGRKGVGLMRYDVLILLSERNSSFLYIYNAC
jgi:hypothetical protein